MLKEEAKGSQGSEQGKAAWQAVDAVNQAVKRVA